MSADPRLDTESELLDDLLSETASSWPTTAQAIERHRSRLREQDPTQPPDKHEALLDQVSWDLRQLILDEASGVVHDRFRSPEHHVHPRLPSGAVEEYTYERSAPATVLESRLARTAPPVPSATASEHVAMNCCMAALMHVVQSTISLMSPDERRPLSIGHWGSYFESDIVLQYLSSSAVRWSSLGGDDGPQDLDGIEVLSVEPIRYNWDLHSLDLASFVRRWHAAARRPSVLIVDTTLPSFTWPMARVIESLRDGSPLLVVEIRSGLKLDQQGLELANVGVVSAYTVDPGPGVPTAAQLAAYLRMVRGVTGSALPAESLAALDLPWVFEPEWLRRHAGQVFLNNARVAAEVPSGGIFTSVSHPAGGGATGPLRHAPFTVFRLTDDHVENHRLLLSVLRKECRRRGDVATIGSSFGFRGHRFETIIPRTAAEQGLFKVAAGARSGPALDNLIRALRQVAAFPDIEALSRAYPDIRLASAFPSASADAP